MSRDGGREARRPRWGSVGCGWRGLPCTITSRRAACSRTRIIHSHHSRPPTRPPTCPPPECDGWCDYPVADRPNAVRQFLDAAARDPSMVKAPWLYIIETDFVWVKPVQAPPAESGAKSIGFPCELRVF